MNRQARNKSILAIQDYFGGRTSNDEFMTRFEVRKDDLALVEIYNAMWNSSDDLTVHNLTGKYSPSGDWIKFANRCIIFLQSDLEYSPTSFFARVVGRGRRDVPWWPFPSLLVYAETVAALAKAEPQVEVDKELYEAAMSEIKSLEHISDV